MNYVLWSKFSVHTFNSVNKVHLAYPLTLIAPQ
jgi:hypothetical protein